MFILVVNAILFIVDFLFFKVFLQGFVNIFIDQQNGRKFLG